MTSNLNLKITLSMEWGMIAWQIFSLLFFVGILFLIVRLLIIKNFPRKKTSIDTAWIGLPAYPISIFWRLDDARFVAEVPDLPGCMADGGTQAEALANAAVSVGEWLETARKLNRPIPAPSARLRYA
ncbi:type II toxin-antitoxin system HicB family antitoxin [Hymenobacter algoricola]|uniref:HicB-like antitoxin of toxin-antitoxin system domain-containing protein n=1 Tax=Hymenobacter algoricola TaxID=486267 RepID=A0ABP7NP22_9BACT